VIQVSVAEHHRIEYLRDEPFAEGADSRGKRRDCRRRILLTAAHFREPTTAQLYELDSRDIEIIKESLRYSMQRIDASQDTPYEQSKEKLAAIEHVLGKLPRVVATIPK
jgi:hypothetical protein